MNLEWLPSLNAGLNTASAFLIVIGVFLIRRRVRLGHAVCMCSAMCLSALFLISYLYYHYHHGITAFPHRGWLRFFYFAVLIPHSILAVAVPPLTITALVYALRGRFDRHVKVVRIAFPVWLYVSVTGVVVYWMLYRMG